MQEPSSYLVMVGMLAGGLGLFLLAVRMITDGLRFAAGSALRNFLTRSTRTPLRGIVSGVGITALVQSSSAVTVATIGFVNAGLLTLHQALGVVYGANVGTTMTGWLVAAVGFKIKVAAFALPMIGIGMFLRLVGSGSRRGALGEALAGFGLFFIGIDVLRDVFTGFAMAEQMQGLTANNPLGLLLFLWIGFLMTVLTQSSSAAIALILTATTGGVLDLSGAAAMVIGANVGTTTTALFAAIGATPKAKRVAAAHIVFNLLTAVVALMLLPVLLWLVGRAGVLLQLGQAPAVALALFHTVFNLFGVLLMLPVTNRLATELEQRFRTSEEIEGMPRYLDDTVVVTPSLALNAVSLELNHMGDIARRVAITSLSTELATGKSIISDRAAMRQLSVAIGDFISRIGRANTTADVSDQLAQVLRITDYYDEVAELAVEFANTEAGLHSSDNAPLMPALSHYRAHVVELLEHADPAQEDFSIDRNEAELREVEGRYKELKEQLLEAGATSRIHLALMSEQIEQLWRSRRVARQAIKAARYLSQLRQAVAGEVREPAPVVELGGAP